ncbi:hypothetical protein ACQPXS_40265 [Streptomyces sp. CA-142005]|uniref:hypothetical protein n=1 Tax=Streptomyces sp. CA-142005 TaxID=3240052 RepID=UPI003D8BA654
MGSCDGQEHVCGHTLQITAAFGMSYDHLSPAAQRLCRRLALVPGPDFAAPVASVLVGSSVPDAEELLDELHELGLGCCLGPRTAATASTT